MDKNETVIEQTRYTEKKPHLSKAKWMGGDHLTACVYNESMNKEECEFTYNSEAQEPERLDVHMG
jgi:hypothetical protein